ncbi:MAG: multi-sensor signal transduction histidine kinase [Acidobacteria bacterium]|nr:multi-sensor signal transduction histidine kinase [Acidobacteriota bacterium]
MAEDTLSALDPTASKPNSRLRFDQRILLLALAAGFPAAVVALLLLWTGDYTPKVQWTLTVFLVGVWTGCSFSVRHRVVLPLQTLSNLLAALRESDFSIRARGASGDDPLGAVMLEVNVLASTLHDQRLGALEAGALLRTVMVEIDVAVFTFDGGQTLRLVNRAGERILAQPAEQLLGRTATELGLGACLAGQSPRIEDVAFPGASGRWEVRRTTFRQGGRPHQLLVLADVSRPLRDEERQAWQRLIRVIGHEINNSLAPIKSIAGSLESILSRYTGADDPRFRSDPDTLDDMKRGLAVIAARSDSLSRFTTAYARLAKLPAPRVDTVNVPELVRRIAGVETRLPIHVADSPDVQIRADPDQLEQLLINLVHNAADAALQTGGAVTVSWKREGRGFELWIDDEGSGLTNASNLFVPFFTTKPGGSGIGLVLSRQIAEAHGGTLTLENRAEQRGCRAYLRLPV